MAQSGFIVQAGAYNSAVDKNYFQGISEIIYR